MGIYQIKSVLMEQLLLCDKWLLVGNDISIVYVNSDPEWSVSLKKWHK